MTHLRLIYDGCAGIVYEITKDFPGIAKRGWYLVITPDGTPRVNRDITPGELAVLKSSHLQLVK